MSELLLASAGSAGGKTYVEDVFSAYTYPGNGGTQTITNGIDLAGKGGMVWVKRRSVSGDHVLGDTSRGPSSSLDTNNTVAEFFTGITAFNSNGFSVGTFAQVNTSGDSLASWTFRCAEKFFAIATWTGDGTSNRQIPHALGLAPGMVTAKRRDAAGSWAVWHRSATGDLYLEQTAAQAGSFTQITAASATTFSVSGNANINGATYVAYLWAHDPDTANGIVQCGSVTTDASGNATVPLGWEPQFLNLKPSSTTGGWQVADTMRRMDNTDTVVLFANLSNSESDQGAAVFVPNATGFKVNGTIPSTTYIYLAIRRGPMRTPTTGASVYNAISYTGTGSAKTISGIGFPPDMGWYKNRDGLRTPQHFDRLRGSTQYLSPSNGAIESSAANLTMAFTMDGANVGSSLNVSSDSDLIWFFRRAPGFMDEVCYSGDGNYGHSIAHNLGVPPELIIAKSRSNAAPWLVATLFQAASETDLTLNTTGAGTVNTYASGNGLCAAAPTASDFKVSSPNTAAATYVAHLFATLAGVSKVGSYTGNGGTQTINCGFAAGARFVLIKRTDAAGDWFVWDTVRGIVAANDPHLSLNTTAAEVTTDDSIDPDASGFIVNQVSGIDINVNGASYIFLAIS